MKFELLVWNDGVPRLYFEDAIHGKDIVIVLRSDGAYHCTESAQDHR